MTQPRNASPGGEGTRSVWQLIWSRGFGVFFFARLATAIGTWLFSVTSMIAAFEVTGSALFVGIVSTAQFAPQLLLGPLAGRWTDRGSIKIQMMLGRCVVSIAGLGLSAWFWWGADGTDSMAVAILSASLVFGFGLVLGGPAMQSAGPELVSREELPAAMALSTAPMTVGRIAGPVIGALSAVVLGYGYAFVISAALSILFIGMVAGIHFPAIVGRREGDKYPMREALGFLRANRPALLCLIGVTAVGIGSEPLITLAAPLAMQGGGRSADAGTLVTMIGFGAALALLASSALASRVRHEYVVCIGLLIMAAALWMCVIPIPLGWAAVPFAASGFGFILTQSSLGTILQLRLPSLLRGRVMALWLIGFVGSRPIGAMTVGAVTDASNVYFAFGVGGFVMLCAAWICRPSQLRPRV